MNYADFYEKYHEIDSINCKISLEKLIKSNTDLLETCRSIINRLFSNIQNQKALFLYGKEKIFMK